MRITAIDGRPIFAGLDIRVRRGLITAVMGPSGTGKTTLLRLITGQLFADSGQVLVFGRDIATLSSSEIYATRKRTGMLFQNGALLTDINVFDNVAFPVREHTDLPESVIRKLVLTKLEAVGLRGAAELMPSELSGGMARRVALARAIVMDPEVLLYDEPFVGLDPISLGMILRLIKHMNQALGITSIVVSHDVQELATIADQSYLLSGGKRRRRRHTAGARAKRLRDGASVHDRQRRGPGANFITRPPITPASCSERMKDEQRSPTRLASRGRAQVRRHRHLPRAPVARLRAGAGTSAPHHRADLQRRRPLAHHHHAVGPLHRNGARPARDRMCCSASGRRPRSARLRPWLSSRSSARC